jgi:hypothetical protein
MARKATGSGNGRPGALPAADACEFLLLWAAFHMVNLLFTVMPHHLWG